MALTFKSSTPEERVLIERGTKGDQRVCRAVQSPHSTRQWDITLEHPDGQTWRGALSGADDNDVYIGMLKMMNDSRNEFIQGRARGHRPPIQARDTNVPVNDLPGETYIRPRR